MAGRGGGAGRLGVVVAVAVLGLLSGSAMAVEVVNLPTPPPSGGPNNGGHFRFGTVSWNKLQHQPPKIRFTVEAAFRRTYAATNFRGSGVDGFLITGDTFKPSGLETIMFDFGDGSMLSPIQFTAQAYSMSEDWVQGVATFEHTYAALSSSTPFESSGAGARAAAVQERHRWLQQAAAAFPAGAEAARYQAAFKGCCRLSELAANADTSWKLVSKLNVRDDDNSPRITLLPEPISMLPPEAQSDATPSVQTVVRKMRPAGVEPSMYVPASDEIFGSTGLAPVSFTTVWEKAVDIGHAPVGLAMTVAPHNLANVLVHPHDGLVTVAA
ncbi:hypothetical protein T484DRAFT_1820317, partial [Baffinella frigidus]